jgi:osmotically-inducible protein OsmY
MTAHRPDAEIFGDARAALDRCPTVPRGIHVHVNGGVVRLTGSAEWPFERADAEHAVRGIAGIRQLVNNIVLARVVNPAGFEAPDPSR